MPEWLSSTTEGHGFEELQRRFAQMLEDGRHIYDAASNALLGGADPEVIREDLFDTDARINRTEQQIRRGIVVHGTVHGVSHFPSLLVLMSVAKDAERIGDYAKNLFDLAAARPTFSEEERAELVDIKDKTSKLLVRARYLYESEDGKAARAFLTECDQLEDLCDEGLERCLTAPGNATALALTFRYFKRVISHASNIVTSLVMPLDKLDFFDES